MKVGLAQTKPISGDVAANITQHVKLINLALSGGADFVLFPELSITGYEPTLAKELATTTDDARLAVFQEISNQKQLTLGIGAPIKTAAGITISLLLFQPNRQCEIYAKQYLHPDEEPFFVRGQNTTGLVGDKIIAALAICYELSVPAHAETAFRRGAEIYMASVAKAAEGVNKAAERLAEIARLYAMTVMMVNCIGPCDEMICGGKTAVWNNKGELLGQLNDTTEGILLFDTATQEVQVKTG